MSRPPVGAGRGPGAAEAGERPGDRVVKIRGAANKMRSLSPKERRRGVVAVSSGNHGRAVARVAADLGVAATICLSSRVPPVKVAAITALGAEAVIAGPTQDDADAEARRLVAKGRVFVHPFDDPLVIAGQGTIGLEVLEDLQGITTLVVPLSGGGLTSGIAVAAKALCPGVGVVGVSQDRGPAMHNSLRAGRLVEVVEGGGAVGAAALLAGKLPVGPSTVLVVSGGNVNPALPAGFGGRA